MWSSSAPIRSPSSPRFASIVPISTRQPMLFLHCCLQRRHASVPRTAGPRTPSSSISPLPRRCSCNRFVSRLPPLHPFKNRPSTLQFRLRLASARVAEALRASLSPSVAERDFSLSLQAIEVTSLLGQSFGSRRHFRTQRGMQSFVLFDPSQRVPPSDEVSQSSLHPVNLSGPLPESFS